MDEYRFLTTWLLDAEHERVWDELFHPERWPGWWPGVESVEQLTPGNDDGVGAVYDNVWRSRLPYSVRFVARTTAVERPRRIDVAATGELVGTGRWRLYAGETLAVTYEWNVRTAARWMKALAPVARRAFGWNHDWVMRGGGQALAERVGGRLVAHS